MKVAFIGGGWVAEERHIPIFKRHFDIEIIGLVDTNPSKVSYLKERFSIPYSAVTSDAEKVPWLEDADAIIITTPPYTHHYWIHYALMKGKHVLTEKPFAASREEALQLYQLAKAKNKILSIVHNNIFSHSALTIKKWIKSGKLGEIKSLHINLLNSPKRRLPDWYDSLPFGLFYDEFSHFLYLSWEFIGSKLIPLSGSVSPSSIQAATPALVLLHLQSKNIPLYYTANFEAPICEWHLVLVGSKAIAIMDIFRDIPIYLPTDNEHMAIDHIRTLLYGSINYWTGSFKSGTRFLTKNMFFGTDKVIERFILSLKTNIEDTSIGVSHGLEIFLLLWDCIDMLNKNIHPRT